MTYHTLENNIEQTLKASGVSKTDLHVISHQVQTEANPRGDQVDLTIRHNHEERKKSNENRKQWIERKRDDEDFFQNLTIAAVTENLVGLKIFLFTMEKQLAEKIEASGIALASIKADKNQQEIFREYDAAALTAQLKSPEQLKLAEMLNHIQEAKTMLDRLDKIDDEYSTVLEENFNKSLEIKEEKWLKPLNQSANVLVAKLKLENDRPLETKMNAIIASQVNASPESKEKLQSDFKQIIDDSNELLHKLTHNRATPEEKLKRIAPLREAMQLTYQDALEKEKAPKEAEAAATNVAAVRDTFSTSAGLMGAYRTRYYELNEKLKACNPPLSVQELFGKSLMKLAGEDANRSEAHLKKYHESLQKLVETYNPDNDRVKLLELAHERDSLVNGVKTKVAEIDMLSTVIPGMKDQFQKGLHQLSESVAGSSQMQKSEAAEKVEQRPTIKPS